MSVRTIEYRSKKRFSHSPSRKTKSPSYFPRHLVNKFEGEHLSIHVHPASKQWRRDWKGKDAYISSARVEDIIIKFIGLPYADMCKELYHKLKECKTNVVKDVDKELSYFFGPRYRIKPEYGIDSNGNIFKLKPLKNQGLHLSPSQIKWNKSQKIPNWGAICRPRILVKLDSCSSYRYNVGSPAVGSNLGEFYNPKLIGEYWCIVHKNIVKLSVYHVPQGQAYLDWATELPSRKWDRNSKTYVKFERLPKYSDGFKLGQGKHEAEIFESQWAVPYIYMGKDAPGMFHFHKVEGANPEYASILDSIERVERRLRDTQTNSAYRMEQETYLEDYQRRLKNTPETCILEAGYGQLYPLVRESDYRKYMKL